MRIAWPEPACLMPDVGDPGRHTMEDLQHMLRCGFVALLAFTLAAAEAVAADPSYPARPVTVIVPFAAGGPTDVVGRILGDHMSRTLGQQFVVENIGGAGGTIGMSRVASAEPDGYTLGVGNMGTQSAAPALYPNLKYDPATSFEQIGIANFTPQAIVAKKDNPATDLKAFIAYLKDNHSKLSYGHAGVGSISHVSGVLFNHQFGLRPALVAYRGTAPALNDLVGGQIDYMVDQSLNVIPQIKGGTIKVFAIAAADRLQSLPEVPTTKEAGVDFVFRAWNALVAPKGTPKPVVDALSAALDKALDDPATIARYVELGSTAPERAERGPAGLQKLVESEVARITPVLKEATTK
ncbi:MAG TPA: tripartite tricarboxylate transporter substrate-binding protein [Hyphomicrobiaceae bacterium]|nr:tripartite tricarboxylate transporter substrate-binding protein [Hyphomicrobiaceae bacterium]